MSFLLSPTPSPTNSEMSLPHGLDSDLRSLIPEPLRLSPRAGYDADSEESQKPRTLFTGEFRTPLRERVRQMRSQQRSPAPSPSPTISVRPGTPIPRASGESDRLPLTPTLAGVAEEPCPGAPRKPRALRRMDGRSIAGVREEITSGTDSSSYSADDEDDESEKDILLDARANTEHGLAARNKRSLDLAAERRRMGDSAPGRTSPLRTSVSIEDIKGPQESGDLVWTLDEEEPEVMLSFEGSSSSPSPSPLRVRKTTDRETGL
ncbi:hypothetical protein F4780DRAFT_670404 [Xylariomycetidae sp. FL0641]|nr:hypothetical protein F4780DRAFT_670404 [Xylariomycetidae sp. FL0641]